MRVLYVHSGNLFGGVESLMLTLVQHQNICPDMEPHFALCFEGRFSEELRAWGAPIYSLGSARASRPSSVMRARRNLRALFEQQRFDVAVCHSAWTQAIFGPVIRASRTPQVLWIHDVPDGMPWPERWARWSPPPAFVLTNSQYTAERLPRLYPQVPSKLIYCPVAPPAIQYSGADLETVRAEFNTPTDAIVILQISRLEPHKGHLAHLEALALLRDVPDWICWQVGDVQRPEESRYFETVKDAAVRLGIEDRVRFPGWQPNVQKLLAVCDIYCQPNIYPEPFGITFIEALYAGKPVIATAIGGPKEIVDESCGFLVPPNNPGELASALRDLIQNKQLRVDLGRSGPRRARQLCDPASQIRTLYEAFVNVSGNGLN